MITVNFNPQFDAAKMSSILQELKSDPMGGWIELISSMYWYWRFIPWTSCDYRSLAPGLWFEDYLRWKIIITKRARIYPKQSWRSGFFN